MEMIVQPVVSLAVERVGEWLVGRANLSTQVRSEVEGIQRNLRWMTIILRNSSAKHKQTGAWHNFVVEIEDIAYDAEDVIETFILTEPMRDRRRRGIIHFFLKKGACIYKESVEHHNVVSEIKDVRIRISELFTILQAYGMIRPMVEGEESSSSAQERARLIRRTYSHVVEEDFIDMENDVKKLVGHLVNEDTDNYQTVCICGMGGLGKTTLAQKVYNHKDVKRHFDYLVWACISQQPQKQDVLQGILIKLEKKEKEIRHMRDEELTRLLRQVQLDKRCLIVLDDIWEQGDWDILKFAFPIGEATRSKLLLTTRNKQLASYVNPRGFLHEPRLLNEGEAWELLQKKAFKRAHGSSDNRPDKKIEELGIKMVRHCGGLPLAVVVLGGILVTKHTEEEWEKVHRNINSHISKGTSTVRQEDGGVSQVLGLSYDDLPFQLKRCFLYLGSFPEDSQIELEKLYQLWIAEDLILSGDIEGEDTMMDVAERYLSELAQRYMVHLGVESSIVRDGIYGSLKYCRLHDMMRELSKSRSKGENFFNVIDSEKISSSSSSSSSSSNAKVRRVAIHRHLGKEKDHGDWLSTQYYLRSLLLFGIINSCHWKDLKVLRVVHLEVRLRKLPKAIGKLIHLRYLSLKGCERLKSLPSSIGNLRCLQTLDLRNNGYYYMSIPNVLWKIKSLTHLYLCELIKRQGKKMRLSGLGKLEILENFDSSSCDVKDLSNLKNLRKLTARFYGDDVEVADFVNLSRLRHSSLELNGVIGGGKLPAVHHFSPSLTALSLSNSKLKEDPMLTLGKLPNLTHLSLSLDAFEGVEMVCSEEGFPQLKFLRLFRLYNLEEWRVDEGAMPNLFKLQIINCPRLKKVPDGLKFISTLQELNIKSMPYEFVRRLGGVDGEEGEDQYKIQHVPNILYKNIHN